MKTIVFMSLFCISLTANCAAVKASLPKESVEWPPYSQQLQDGPRSGYYPHTDAYVTTMAAPQFLRKGMYFFSIPTIWYEKHDGSVLMDEGFLLKKAKNQFVNGRVCDAVALGIDMKPGNYGWICESDMIDSDKYYFRKDDPVLTGSKVKKGSDNDQPSNAEKSIIG